MKLAMCRAQVGYIDSSPLYSEDMKLTINELNTARFFNTILNQNTGHFKGQRTFYMQMLKK